MRFCLTYYLFIMNLNYYIKLLFVIFFLIFSFNFYSQNLLSTASWTIGNGSVSGFDMNGNANENIREYGQNHVGEQVILWKAVPDGGNDNDGGWNTPYIFIDNSKTYRFSVWIKKTNSNDGTTYFGCQEWSMNPIASKQILNLNGQYQNNPYFWYGDLPQLDNWYLLIGFIHQKNYTQTINIGGIYDGRTGALVHSITDYKFDISTSQIRHRAYLFYDTNITDRQYFYAPRLEALNGDEWSLDRLLSVNPDSKLLFVFDNAGNQKQRYYCQDSGCSEPDAPLGRAIIEEDDSKEEEILAQKDLRIYPNPTKGQITVSIVSDEDISFRDDIQIFNNNGVLVYEGAFKDEKSVTIDLGRLSNGTYLLHAHLSDGTTFNKQIIKN